MSKVYIPRWYQKVYYWYHVASNCNCSNGMSHIQAGIIFKTKLANVFPIYLLEQCSPLFTELFLLSK